MSKIQHHQNELRFLFSGFLQTGDEKKLTEYLVLNSNLPGRRANLELAKAFTIVVEEYWEKDNEILWNLIISLVNITPDQAPVNNPKEFLPFCATWALGSIGAASELYYSRSVYLLKQLANDPRWRLREAVAKGIQKLIRAKSKKVLEELATWIIKNQWLTMRAVVTGVAEPSLLQDNQIAKQALELHKEILDKVKNSKNRKPEEFKILRKGLAYSLSVVVQAIPKDGFQYLEELISYKDKDIYWILKQNLTKQRLTKYYPSETRALNKLLQ